MAAENSRENAIRGLWKICFEETAVLRWFLLILLAVGSLWSLVLFVNMIGYSEASPAIPLSSTKPGASAAELSVLIEETRAVASARSGELFSANTSARRYPFAPVPEESQDSSFGAAIGGDAPASYREPLYTEPVPAMTVKGVMVMGEKAVAVISVGGEEGILAEAGYTFGDGKGKIESVSSDKVVISWMGERKEVYVTP